MTKKSIVEKITEEAEKDTEAPVTEIALMLKEQGFDIASWERATFEIWKPEIGEYIIGSYKTSFPLPEEYKRDGMKGDVMIHHIHDHESDQVVSFVGGFAADQAFESVKPAVGDMVFVQYRGQKETKGDKRVNNWDIRFKPKS